MARDASAHAAARVGEILQSELGLSADAVASQVRDYVASVEHEKSVLMGDSE
jgi:glycerol-3-phosphate dehydrogenase